MDTPIDPHEETAFAATAAASDSSALPSQSERPQSKSLASRGHVPVQLPPAEVPGYQVLRMLGRGAFGTVWLARQHNTGKAVAIKFYAHSEGLDWNLLQREVEKLAHLYTERDIVQLLAVGWDAKPPYYVMEYLENGSLSDVVRHRRLSITDAVKLIREVTQALVHAHGRGILHCDLKPANVLLDHDFRPRLCDFGQSRLTSELRPSLGTFFYMAPEQADLDAVPDARWDVYALGAMLFALLTGNPPYKNKEFKDTLQSASTLRERLQLYREMLKSADSPAAELRKTAADSALIEIVMRCLAFEPEQRFPNAQAVLSALDARQARRQRRPLMVLGTLGPVLLLLLLSLLGWKGARTAVATSSAALTQRALMSNRFAAQFVAEAAAREVDRRWRALEESALDIELRAGLQTLAVPGISHEQVQKVQDQLQIWVERLDKEHHDLEATSWFVADAQGLQWARIPESDTIGKNWSFRDYFHGQGRDFPRDGAPHLVQPIQAPYLSVVFPSQANGRRIVAFSTPIWSGKRDDAGRRVLGVLGMTVALGHFGELRPTDGRESRQIAVLVDSRVDWTGSKGLLLQHPHFMSLNRQGIPLPAYRLDEETISQIQRLRAPTPKTPAEAAELTVKQLYSDPVAGEFSGRWLAAIEPVRVRSRDSGWVVLVQERYPDIIEPVDKLGRTLVHLGVWGLGAVTALLAALWALVVWLMNAGVRSNKNVSPALHLDEVHRLDETQGI